MSRLRFIDFCSGIGGGRIGLENGAGAVCVGYSEINDKAIQTYGLLHDAMDEKNYGDLTELDSSKLPDFDILMAGFPCQSFSIVGKRHGLNDERGRIIYRLVKILRERKPPYFILENVKGLISHQHGRTLETILGLLNGSGYRTEYRVISSSSAGIPQIRERIYFVGIRRDRVGRKPFVWFEERKLSSLRDYLIDRDGAIVDHESGSFQRYVNNRYNRGRFNIKRLLKEDCLVLDTRQSDLRLYRDVVPTLRAERHGILYVRDGQLHKLSSMEALLLQGFGLEKSGRKKHLPETRLLSQAGNAMTATVIGLIARQLVEFIHS